MVNNPLDFQFIYTRKRLLDKRKVLTEVSNLKIPEVGTNDNSYKERVESFIQNSTDFDSSLSLLESLYSNNYFNLLESSTQIMIRDIIPMIESEKLNECITRIENKNIGEINRDRLIETVKMYKTIDRISNNHSNISKRFGLDAINKYSSNRVKCHKICEMVDTYNQSRFIKFNIALEEICYLYFTEQYSINESDMVSNVLDYFLMINDNTSSDIESYKRAIKESKVLSEQADSNVKYFTEDKKESTEYDKKLNEWKLDTNKNVNGLISLIKENCGDITILRNTVSILKEFVHINNIDFNELDIFSELSSTDGKSARNIISIIKENKISGADSVIENLEMIFEADSSDISYDDGTKTPKTFSSNDIKEFQINDLISDSQAVGEFLDKIEDTSKKTFSVEKILKDGPAKINESNFIDNIDSNGYINLRLRSYKYTGNVEDVYNMLESAINCMNNILYKHQNRCYYSLYEDSFDIGIRSRFKVSLTESELINRGLDEDTKYYMYNLDRYTNILESTGRNTLRLIRELDDSSFAASITPSVADLLFEVLSPYKGENGFLEEFLNICNFEANPMYEVIKESYMNKEPDIDLFENHDERVDFAISFIQEAKKEKSTIDSINDAKLAWNGIKSKLKQASAKEQEMSRDLDMEYNHLINNLKSAFTVDHREEIITGQVNRSLSKALKIAIPLALAGGVTGIAKGKGLRTSLAAAAIGPAIEMVVKFATSKFATTKEKKMILDEIDIELKVLEREINKAESEGSTKAYRDLLTIQRNLQRKRQEIYYGLAKKGKRIPISPTAGLKTK